MSKFEISKKDRKMFLPNGFYSLRHLMSFDRNTWIYRFIIGDRGIGKTYQVGNLLANFYQKVKHIPDDNNNVDDLFCYYRLKPRQLEQMAGKILKPETERKHNIKVRQEKDKIYFNDRYMGNILALKDAPLHKGGNWPWQRYRYIIIDEFQLERRERRDFDIVYNLRSTLESVFRFTTRTKLGLDFPTIILTGNTVDEVTDLLFIFDFMPEKFGTYKLKKKFAIMQYVPSPKAYRDMQRKNPLSILNQGDDFTFGERQIKSEFNVIPPDKVGHRKFIAFLHVTQYLRFEVWSTQKGYLYVSRGLPTKKFENRHFTLRPAEANKGTTYNIEFHKLIRKNYNSNNIYFDKRISAQTFLKNLA